MVVNLKKLNFNTGNVKRPKYTIEQQIKANKRNRKLVNQLYNKKSLLVIDDEKYFFFAGNNMPGNSGYYTNSKERAQKVFAVDKESNPLNVSKHDQLRTFGDI